MANEEATMHQFTVPGVWMVYSLGFRRAHDTHPNHNAHTGSLFMRDEDILPLFIQLRTVVISLPMGVCVCFRNIRFI